MRFLWIRDQVFIAADPHPAPAESAPLRIGAHRSMWGSFEVIADRMGYWKKKG